MQTELEQSWYKQSKIENVVPTGDTMEVIVGIVEKYIDMSKLRKYKTVTNAFPKKVFHFHGTWTRDLGVLRMLCDETPNCGGFTSSGMMFLPGATFISSHGSIVFVKTEGEAPRTTTLDEVTQKKVPTAVMVGMLFCFVICAVFYLVMRNAVKQRKTQ